MSLGIVAWLFMMQFAGATDDGKLAMKEPCDESWTCIGSLCYIIDETVWGRYPYLEQACAERGGRLPEWPKEDDYIKFRRWYGLQNANKQILLGLVKPGNNWLWATSNKSLEYELINPHQRWWLLKNPGMCSYLENSNMETMVLNDYCWQLQGSLTCQKDYRGCKTDWRSYIWLLWIAIVVFFILLWYWWPTKFSPSDYFVRLDLIGTQLYFMRKRKASKLGWFTVNVISGMLLCHSTYDAFALYSTKPIDTTYQIVEHDMLSAPDIIICHHTRFDPSKLKGYNVSTLQQLLIEVAFVLGRTRTRYAYQLSKDNLYAHLNTNTYNLSMASHDVMANILAAVDHLKKITIHHANGDPFSMVHKFFWSCHDIIPFCYTNGFYKWDCCNSATSFLTGLGRCHSISFRDQFSSMENANMFRLYVKLPSRRFETPSFAIPLNEGLEVRFRNPATGDIDEGFSLVPLGFETTIDLSIISEEFVNHVASPCKSGLQYDRRLCEMRCMDRGGEICNCTAVDMLPAWPTGTSLCFGPELLTCYYRIMDKYKDDYATESIRCGNQCPRPCTRETYFKVFKHIRMSSRRAKKHLATADIEEWDNDMAIVNLQFPFTKVTQKQYVSFGMLDLMAEVGGYIGVWIGGCFLTIIHIVVTSAEYSIKVGGLLYQGWKRRRNRVHSGPLTSG